MRFDDRCVLIRGLGFRLVVMSELGSKLVRAQPRHGDLTGVDEKQTVSETLGAEFAQHLASRRTSMSSSTGWMLEGRTIGAVLEE